MTDRELLDAAYKAMEKAYVPYSRFKVGAALITPDNKLYTGCNIENSSYGATICAERTAIAKAVSDGAGSIDRIAIVSSSGEFTYPCGICRQVMSEFMSEDAVIIMEDCQKGITEIPFKEIYPKPFSKDSLK